MYSAGYRPCLAYLRTHGAILHRSRPRGGGHGGKWVFFRWRCILTAERVWKPVGHLLNSGNMEHLVRRRSNTQTNEWLVSKPRTDEVICFLTQAAKIRNKRSDA